MNEVAKKNNINNDRNLALNNKDVELIAATTMDTEIRGFFGASIATLWAVQPCLQRSPPTTRENNV